MTNRREGGQALLEFALVVPLFLLLMLGLIDFSRLLFTYVSFTNGAREMARIEAVSTGWTSTTATNAINAFNNTTVIAATKNASTDNVTVRMGDMSCARTVDIGGTCSPVPTSIVCPMDGTNGAELSTTSCNLTKPSPGGFVEVQVNYTFSFNPLFQNRLAGIIDVSFMRAATQVTTTARAYVE